MDGVTDLSDKYAGWQSANVTPDMADIGALVRCTNSPIRLTQAELEAHPGFAKFLQRPADGRPPLRGGVAVPLVGRDGRNMGVMSLSDRLDGEFTADDEAVLVQVEQVASVALESARLMDDLKVADQRKVEFLATLAHELRNPLAPIRNGLQVMELVRNNGEAVEEARSMMDRQLGQMVHLIDDLVDMSRISRGKVELRKVRAELATVVRQALETSRPLIDDRGHDFTLDVPDEPIYVDADTTRLSQLFANLLNNTAKYTDRAGRIRLAVERRGGDAVVSVTDNGVGIPAPMLPKVFDLFTQVDRSLEKAQGGPGIGLSLVKKLVEMHGGDVKVKSDGHGMSSEFVVTLPVILALVKRASRPTTAWPPPRRPSRAFSSPTTTWTPPRAWPCGSASWATRSAR